MQELVENQEFILAQAEEKNRLRQKEKEESIRFGKELLEREARERAAIQEEVDHLIAEQERERQRILEGAPHPQGRVRRKPLQAQSGPESTRPW